MAHDVYVCYDDEDLEVAQDVVDYFEKNNVECWYRERNMVQGLDGVIVDTINKSKLFVLILSDNANFSNAVKSDIVIAFKSQIPVFTFKIDDCVIDGQIEFFISFNNSIDAQLNYRNELETLFEKSSKILEGEGSDNEPQHDVYICYGEDDLTVAEGIANYFEENGIISWYKYRNMIGDSVCEIISAINDCKLVVFIYSSNSKHDDYANVEVDIAFTENKPIFVFAIDESRLDGYLEFFLNNKHWIEAYPNYQEKYENLLGDCLKILGKPANLSKGINLKSKLRKSFKRKVGSDKSLKVKLKNDERFTHDAYISYSSWDSIIAEEACCKLEDSKLKCWISPRDIAGGEDTFKSIMNGIKNAKFFVLIFSKYSQDSEFVKHELKIAFNLHKPVISFKVDESYPYGEMSYFLKNKYWLDAYPDWRGGLDYLKDEALRIVSETGTRPMGKLTNSKLIPGVGRQPNPAYRGDGEYIFVSYAHKDNEIVFPEIGRFQDLEYNVWYDEGIGAGNEWLKDIVAHLKGCKTFIVFVTNNSMASENVQKEIKYAVKHKKKIIPIYLEDENEIVMDEDIEFELSFLDAIHKTELGEDEYIMEFKNIIGESSVNDAIVQTNYGLNPAYRGNDKYIFASFKAGDENIEFEQIRILQYLEYNVFYDDWNIDPKNYIEEMADYLNRCEIFLVFITNKSMASENIRNQIKYAIRNNKNIIAIYLESPDKIEMYESIKFELSKIGTINKTAMAKDEYILKLIQSIKKFNF